jgi:ABC-type transporter Mla MlaB component
MLRIAAISGQRLTTINLEGKLLKAWLTEVQVAVAAAQTTDIVRLNLHELHYADADGIALLRTLRRGGIELIGPTPFIAQLLAAADEPR